MNILLIDDDKDLLFVLSGSITKQGHQVYTATNGMNALHSLEDHKIDLIISDVVMRDTPILSLTCVLKQKYPKTPIILISGLPTGHLINKSLTLGADEFVPKPIDMSKLLSSINRLGHA
jgi:two-component system, NtrC family, response regulator HydG